MVTNRKQPGATHPYSQIYCAKCGHSITVPKYCKNRFCRTCSFLRSRRVQQRLHQLCRSIRTTKTRRLRFLTLSISNQDNPGPLAKELIRSFRNLRRRHFWTSRVSGGCYVIEIAGHPGSWHLHIHAVIASEYLPWQELFQLWQSISGGRGCWITNISPSAAANYLSKYLTKVPATPVLLEELNDALRGYRLFQPFGDWHSKLKPMPKKPYTCPDCGGQIWLADVVLDLMARGYTPRIHSPPPQEVT